MPSKGKLLKRYCRVAREIMLPFMGPNSCIGATRVTVDCLRSLGIQAEPIATKLAVQIPAKEIAYTSGLSDEELATARNSTRTYGDGWRGHLICRCGQQLLDPSFDQADVALKGLLGADKVVAIMPLPDDAHDSERWHVQYSGFTPSGLAVKIEYVTTGDESYRDSPAWNDEGLPLLCDLILRRI